MNVRCIFLYLRFVTPILPKSIEIERNKVTHDEYNSTGLVGCRCVRKYDDDDDRFLVTLRR